MPDKPTEINIESGVSVFDGKPFVNLIVGKKSEQMRPDKAREIATMLFDCAAAAEYDAALAYGLKKTAGFGREDAGRMLMLVREHRHRFEGLR